MAARSIGEKYAFSWQQTMIRIKDPKVSVPFYERHFGMKLVHTYNFDESGFSLYFLERPRDDAKLPTPGTKEAEKYLWNMKTYAMAKDPDGYWIELCDRNKNVNFPEKYNLSQTMIRVKDPQQSLKFYKDLLGMKHIATVKDENYTIYIVAHLEPNVETPKDLEGFGHIGMLCDDLEKACEELETAGAKFRKKPQEGKMHDIAFLLDPDGYSVELIRRGVTF
ncbi:hypothetical protein Emed_006997 [Eimeria media]